MHYDAESYGEAWAGVYDQHFPNPSEGSLELLREFAGEGPLLELGPGTGRMAGPLSRSGLSVHGVEASELMLERLHERWGDCVQIVGREFSDFESPHRYSLCFVAFNTFFALLSQRAQVRCMQCVADVLKPGGFFLLEVFVPDLGRFDRGQRLATLGLDHSLCRMEASVHNQVEQTVETQLMTITPSGIQMRPVKVRYAWPAELDLMAEIAGLEKAHRWGGWLKQPFTSSATSHITVYRKPE